MLNSRINKVACGHARPHAIVRKLGDLGDENFLRTFRRDHGCLLSPTYSSSLNMYTKGNSSHLLWAFLFQETHLTKFTSCVIIALILLSTPSGGQLISSQVLQNQSLPSNTVLSSNSLKEYIIYSVIEGSSQESDNERIRLHLGMILAPVDVQEYGGHYTGVEFWRVIMNDVQRTAFVSANPRVCSVFAGKIS